MAIVVRKVSDDPLRPWLSCLSSISEQCVTIGAEELRGIVACSKASQGLIEVEGQYAALIGLDWPRKECA